MIPELSKENADRWFNDVRETLKAKRLWWIIMEPETADDIAHTAMSALLRITFLRMSLTYWTRIENLRRVNSMHLGIDGGLYGPVQPVRKSLHFITIRRLIRVLETAGEGLPVPYIRSFYKIIIKNT
jgi:hypothetical protein